ncbi:MAG: hypothetical protein PWQ12_34 [Clostridiales bacterium]|jgi:hypothetical protein|nr:hypothetical protein [Clostridiales bacterium]
MFEKLKDFFYDISDIVLSLVIIALIFYAVSWKISSTLSVDLSSGETQTEEVVVTTEPTTEPFTATGDGQDPTDATGDSETTSEAEATTAPPTESTTQATTGTLVLQDFVVDAGATGYSIGEDLKAEGYIDDVNAFIRRLTELGYDSKLRAGTFRLSTSDDLDTIIRILSGQKR